MSNPKQNYFEYNGKKSTDFQIWINGDGRYASPEPDVESIEVPGRNGALTLWNGRYRNVSVYYRCVIPFQFRGNYDNFRTWLLHDVGYHKLNDTYKTDEFRQARVLSGLDISSIEWANNIGTFTVRFDCMPQRFKNIGDEFQEIYQSGDFIGDYDHAWYPSKPIIATQGYGQITIDHGDNHEDPVTITIAQNTFAYNLYVDCDLENCYANLTTMQNRNSYLTLNDGKFPILLPATKNTITFDNTFTIVKIKPRYFRL
jgi:phage-related protein